MSKVQIIHDAKGKPAYAVVPWAAYARLTGKHSEDVKLIAAGEAARHDEAFPEEVARRLVAGEPPLKVFREWRGFTQGQLASKAKVAPQYVSQLERRAGGRKPGRKVAAKLAKALAVSTQSLMEI